MVELHPISNPIFAHFLTKWTQVHPKWTLISPIMVFQHMEWLPYAIGYSHASIHDLTSTFPMGAMGSMRIFGQILTVSATSNGPLQEQYWCKGNRLHTKVLPFDVY